MKAILSHGLYRQLRHDLDAGCAHFTTGNPFGSLYGLPLETSSSFPFRLECAACDATGEGRESTYCPECKGGGGVMVDGALGNFCPGASTILIRRHLPRRFAPSFPKGLVPPRQPVRIVA